MLFLDFTSWAPSCPVFPTHHSVWWCLALVNLPSPSWRWSSLQTYWMTVRNWSWDYPVLHQPSLSVSPSQPPITFSVTWNPLLPRSLVCGNDNATSTWSGSVAAGVEIGSAPEGRHLAQSQSLSPGDLWRVDDPVACCRLDPVKSRNLKICFRHWITLAVHLLPLQMKAVFWLSCHSGHQWCNSNMHPGLPFHLQSHCTYWIKWHSWTMVLESQIWLHSPEYVLQAAGKHCVTLDSPRNLSDRFSWSGMLLPGL